MEKNRMIGLFVIVGAALAIAGVFISWIHFNFVVLGLNVTYDHTGLEIMTGGGKIGNTAVNLDYDHAYLVTITLVLGAVGALLGVMGLLAGLPKGVAAYIGVILLLVGIAVAFLPYMFAYFDLFSQQFILEKDGFSLGTGAWLSTAGGAIIAIGGIAGMTVRK